jgi:hypothetical protein
MLTTTRPAVKNATYQPAPPPQPNKPTNATSTDATPESMAHKLAVAIEKIQALEALTKLHNRTNSQLRQEAEDQKRLHDRETKHLTAKRDQDLQRAEKEIRELRKVISDVEQDRASKNSALCDDLMEQSERDQEALREAHDKMLNLRDVLDQTQHNLRASQQACRERDAAIKVNGDSIHQLKANLAKERQNRQALEATLTQERQKRLAPIASSERLLPVEVEHLQIMVMSAKRDNDQLQEGLNKTQERKCQLECDLATSQAETERSRLEMEHILATLQASVDTQRTDIIALEDVANTNDKVISALQADRILLLCVVVLASTLIWMEKHNELGKATRQRDHWQLEAAFWKQECDILAHKCDQIEQVRGHAEATIGNLKTRHEEEKRHSDDRIAKMQQTIADRETAIETLKDVVTNMVSQLADLSQVVVDRDGTILRQEESQASVQAQIATLQQEINLLSSNNVQLEADKQVLSTEISNLSANLRQVTDERDTAISENNETRIAVLQQVNELMERKTAMEAMKTEIRSLTCTVDAHDTQMKTAQHHWQKSYSHMETRFCRKLTKARRMIGGGPCNESLRHHYCNIPSKPSHDFHCGDKQHSFFATDFDYPIGDHGEKFLFRPEKADSGLDHISSNEDDASNSSNASAFLHFDDEFGGFHVGDDPSDSANGIVDVTVAVDATVGGAGADMNEERQSATVTAAVGNIHDSDPLVSTEANGERGIGRNSGMGDASESVVGDTGDSPPLIFNRSSPSFPLNLHRLVSNYPQAIRFVELPVKLDDRTEVPKQHFQVVDKNKLVDVLMQCSGDCTQGDNVDRVYANFTRPFNEFGFVPRKNKTKTWRHENFLPNREELTSKITRGKQK